MYFIRPLLIFLLPISYSNDKVECRKINLFSSMLKRDFDDNDNGFIILAPRCDY